MTIIFIAVSSLALLAAIVSFSMLLCEKKRSKKRNAALMQYIDEMADGIRVYNSNYMQDVKAELAKQVSELDVRIASLEKGIVPDFEKAKEAADAVNNFNAGITGILGFDPHDVLKKQRGNTGGDID